MVWIDLEGEKREFLSVFHGGGDARPTSPIQNFSDEQT